MEQELVKTKLKIAKKVKINHDCYIYSCVWQGQSFQLKIGQHMRFIANIKTKDNPDGEQVIRKYTPISPCSQKDVIDFLIKVYRATQKFPQGGKMSQHLQNLNEGDTIDVQGPFGRFNYFGEGKVSVGKIFVMLDGEQLKIKRILFMAGGSGITPCYQTMSEIINMPNQNIEMILIFGNNTEDDIIMTEQLSAFQKKAQIHHIIWRPSEKWTGLKGVMNEQVLSKLCPLDDPETLYIFCGPPPMNKAIRDLFSEKYPKSVIFKY